MTPDTLPRATNMIRRLSLLVPQSRVRDALIWRFADLVTKSWPEERVTIVSERGIQYELDLTDPNQRAVYLLGRYESDLVWGIDNLLPQGSFVLEAGTNIGIYSLMFAQKVVAGRVFGFEPLPEARSVAERHILINGIDNIELSASALGANVGKAEIHLFDGMPQGHASLADIAPGKSHSYVCDVTTIDRFVEARHITELHLIKLDVEGAELAALRGGRQTIIDMQPVVFVEINFETTAAFQYVPQDIIDWFETLSYSCFVARRRRWVRVRQSRYLNASENMLCISDHDVSSLAKVDKATL